MYIVQKLKKNIAFIPVVYVHIYHKKFVDLRVCNVCNVTLLIVIVYVINDYFIGVPHPAFCAPKHAESSSWGTPDLQTP